MSQIVLANITTFIGELVKYFYDWKKDRANEKEEILKKKEEQRKNRPEFLITNMKDNFNRPGTCIDSQACDLEVFVTPIDDVKVGKDNVFAVYDDSILDKKSWVSRQYTLKNVGRNVVYQVNIISYYKRDTCIFQINAIREEVMKQGILNYSELLAKRIAPGENFTLKLCYHKDRINGGSISAILGVGMRDDDGAYWVQPFFAPENKLYESSRITYKEYRDDLLPDKAIDCFRNPYLW
jgi:hypothetical protein